MVRCDGLVSGRIRTLPFATHAPMRLHHRGAKCAVRREHAVVARQVHAWRRHQRRKACDQIQPVQHDDEFQSDIDRFRALKSGTAENR